MICYSIITALILGSTLSVPFQNLKIIILCTVANNLTLDPSKRFSNPLSINKLDIEQYDEITEQPNIDNFDYNNMNKRSNTDNIKEDEAFREVDPLVIHSMKEMYMGDKVEDKNNTLRNRDTIIKADEFDRNEAQFGNNDGVKRVVGGKEVVSMNQFPYQVAYIGTRCNLEGMYCGGVIIDKRWALTAAHCKKQPYIRIGSKYWYCGYKIAVKRHIIHPNYIGESESGESDNYDYDFQLLKLAEDLEFGESVQPIKLARMEDMRVGKILSVTGWGNTEESGEMSEVLRVVRIPLISRAQCERDAHCVLGKITPRMFCAGCPKGGKDSCQGDSGGPAVSGDRLFGLTSFGYGCARSHTYGVYSKVAVVRPWIEKVTKLTLD